MSVFNYEKDADGIVTVTMDMTGPVNSMNEEYDVAMSETLAKLEADDDLTGVVLASAKKVFFAGGNIHDLLAMQPGQEEAMFTQCEVGKAQLRRLEKLPVPVVAAINGAALGGGFEICLSCNYRIAYNHKSVQIGLPEQFQGVENPFPWMSEIMDLRKEKNFFESRVLEYQTGGSLDWNN